MRTIGVVTVGRSDYGIYRPLLRSIEADPTLQLRLFVGGTHLSPAFGLTARDIEADGFEIAARIEMLLASDAPAGIAKSMGFGTAGFAQAYAHCRPDILVVLGDRFEMHAAAVAALPFNIPVAHLHGGELTAGTIDDALRHSITKLSHIHFVAVNEYRQRVIQLGEEPWRVTVCGALSLDNLRTFEKISRSGLEAMLRLSLEVAPLLVTFHPTTLEYEHAEEQVVELLTALESSSHPIVFTAPNADTSNTIIREHLIAFAQSRANACFVENLGTQAYFSLMAASAAMVGNSSSGIIEAPSFCLPVVNIGARQQGRFRASNVIDVECARTAIATGLQRALDPQFRRRLVGQDNPYGDGHASDIIVSRLRAVDINRRLIEKEFWEVLGADD